jgi:hypothetical protein
MTAPLTDYIYVDVAIGGVSHRNHVQRFDEVVVNGTADCYTSYQRATSALVDWVASHKNTEGKPTVAGFDGPTWTPYLPLDVDDRQDPACSLEWTRQILHQLAGQGAPLAAIRCHFSGQKGFHVEVPAALFGGFEPSRDLHRHLKHAAQLVLQDIPYDHSVYDKLRLWRLPNSQHSKTELYKIPLTADEVLTLGIDEIRALARQPRDLPGPADAYWPAVPALVTLWQQAQQATTHAASPSPGAITDNARDQQTIAAIVAAWPHGGAEHAGQSRHADLLLPLLGFLTGRTASEHASGLAKAGARQAGDRSFLDGRDWEAEIDRLADTSASKRVAGEEIVGLPTLAAQFPSLAAVLAALWPATTSPAGAQDHSADGESTLPFPLETLPPPFRDLVRAGAASMVVAPDFLALPLLVTAGAVIGNALELEVKPGWREGPNLFAAYIGDPGSKKSPAMKLATGALRRIQKQLAHEYEDRLAEYEQALARWEGAPKADRGVKPKPPPYGHVFTTDATVEALAPILRDSKGLVLIKDELVGWVKSMDAYRGGRGSDRQHYLSWWSRMADKVDRKGTPVPIWIEQPCLAVVGGIQPDLLPDLADATQREDGFPDRLLFAFPEPPRDGFVEAGVDPALEAAVYAIFERLHRLLLDEDNDGPRPHVVRMSRAAQALWREWYDAHVAEQESETFPRRLRGPWAKFPSQLLRLMLILHALREPAPTQCTVSAETFGAAADLLDYFASHARKVYRHLGQQQRGMTVKILAALKANGEMLQRDLLHDVFHGHGGERIRAALEELEEAGLICRQTREHTGGRNGTAWRSA